MSIGNPSGDGGIIPGQPPAALPPDPAAAASQSASCHGTSQPGEVPADPPAMSPGPRLASSLVVSACVSCSPPCEVSRYCSRLAMSPKLVSLSPNEFSFGAKVSRAKTGLALPGSKLSRENSFCYRRRKIALTVNRLKIALVKDGGKFPCRPCIQRSQNWLGYRLRKIPETSKLASQSAAKLRWLPSRQFW